MDSIGDMLRSTREETGISIAEVCNDLEIKEQALENIEEGKIGAFKDVFELKSYIFNYAKYLGLDAEAMIDEFNEYMFEITSKIPMKEIEKAAREKAEAEENEERVASPYTKAAPKSSDKQFVLMLLFLFHLHIF